MRMDIGQASNGGLSQDVCNPALTLTSFPDFHNLLSMAKYFPSSNQFTAKAGWKENWIWNWETWVQIPAELFLNGEPLGRSPSC